MPFPRPDLDTAPDGVFESLDTTREAMRAVYAMQDAADAAAPKVGDLAPDFALATLLADRSLGPARRLSGLRGRPVALIFGSYT